MKAPHARAARGERAAFTLLELLIVLAILGLLAALILPRMGGKVQAAQVDTTRVQISNLSASVEQFAIDVGRYPTSDEGLQALVTKPAGLVGDAWDGPYLQKPTLPKDAWGRAFIYEPVGGRFVIRSLGADGALGGEGFNADLSSDT